VNHTWVVPSPFLVHHNTTELQFQISRQDILLLLNCCNGIISLHFMSLCVYISGNQCINFTIKCRVVYNITHTVVCSSY